MTTDDDDDDDFRPPREGLSKEKKQSMALDSSMLVTQVCHIHSGELVLAT